jgi:hypothetical protein
MIATAECVHMLAPDIGQCTQFSVAAKEVFEEQFDISLLHCVYSIFIFR